MGKSNAPKADSNSDKTPAKREPIGHPITLESFRTCPAPVMNIRVTVVYTPVEKIEDIAEHDRRQGHGTPILGQPIDTERLSDKRWVYAKEESIGH